MAEPDNTHPAGAGWTPRPDPTVLTTEQLHREIAALETRIGVETGALKSLLEASIQNVKEIVADRIECHDVLDDERFERIKTRFETLENHRVEQKDDTKARINYAIDALKERADEHYKSNQEAIKGVEKSIESQLEKLTEGTRTTADALQQRHDDLKERVAKMESLKVGAAEQRTEGRAHISTTTAVIGTIIAVIGIGLALLVGHNTRNPDVVPVTPQIVTVTTPSTP